MNGDLSNPGGWSEPVKIVDGGDWYPWVLGLGDDESTSVAGERVRLFVRAESELEILFRAE
jgi:hypothetical protein